MKFVICSGRKNFKVRCQVQPRCRSSHSNHDSQLSGILSNFGKFVVCKIHGHTCPDFLILKYIFRTFRVHFKIFMTTSYASLEDSNAENFGVESQDFLRRNKFKLSYQNFVCGKNRFQIPQSQKLNTRNPDNYYFEFYKVFKFEIQKNEYLSIKPTCIVSSSED